MMLKALVIYHTKTGHTLQAAEDIARGLSESGIECTIKAASSLTESGKSDLDEFDIVIFGTPTYGNRLYRLPARPVEKFLDSLSPRGLEGKTCGAFAVNARMGGSKLVKNIEKRLLRLGGKVVTGGPVIIAGVPLSLWKGRGASPKDVNKCEEYGRRVASEATK
ncbi:MAG: flavodoxin domain-containing protein [Actinomycetota bacterium]|nr:flavodoxin domain-containing protein [Actinomycetota bacterium]